ncbi:GNAT family N-acetyltransferase [Staphylococcus delphini]|uniref:GNAT family N-acetyltransferase n=1 Tax=Staphylococcus delphini TaxID=53344 RepID=UPI000BBCADA8|nr:GNAT family N-acetyltransferase [Staphylococcus delphini]PCF85654.1 GNAT family N-acetyltransferase [Staphylococcus delphini]
MDNKNLTFTTERLEIRPLVNSDYDSWLNGFLERKTSQYQYDDGLIDMSICTKSWFEDLVKKHHELIEKDDMYIFAIFNKNQQHIGMIDIVTIRRGNFQWAECGYFIHNQHWRKGYAYEALTKILHIADKALGFHRLEAHVNLDNHPSINLLEKTGFEFECTRKNFIYEFDQWTDNHIYFINFNHSERD